MMTTTMKLFATIPTPQIMKLLVIENQKESGTVSLLLSIEVVAFKNDSGEGLRFSIIVGLESND